MSYKNKQKNFLWRWTESNAADFYIKKGFCINEKNYKFGHYEADIIVSNENLVVFVEVKCRSNDSFGFPESFVTDCQRCRILKIADFYINNYKIDKNIRFDIVSYLVKKDSMELRVFEDAFY